MPCPRATSVVRVAALQGPVRATMVSPWIALDRPGSPVAIQARNGYAGAVSRRKRPKGYYVRPVESVEAGLHAYTHRENARRAKQPMPGAQLTPNGVVLFAFYLGLSLFEKLEALDAAGSSTCPWCGREGGPRRPEPAGSPASSDEASSVAGG